MVEIVFENASFFKRIIESLKGLVNSVVFECTPDAMNLQAMDVSHVSLISICLPSESFSSYRVSDTMNLAFNTDVIFKLLKGANANDILTLICEHSDDDIEMQITSPNEDKNTRFRIKRIDDEQDQVGITDHDYKAKLTLSSSTFNNLVRNLSEVNDAVNVKCTSTQIDFSVNDSVMEATTTFHSGIVNASAKEEIELEVEEPCKVSYALRYLKAISAAAALSDRVSLSFAESFPLLVEYSLSEGGYVRFYLAPKVVEDDESDEI